ncbi:MAG: serine/threonine protein phosphatase, partial [Thermodesulfobacteriota bacterium]|nr:serine/threonine protein phosphatase [Thermodesulfobacteriota bacterium]
SEWLLWARGKFIPSEYDFGKPVIFGHTDLKEPLIEKNKIGIDTGAVYGGRLSCLVLPDMKFISVDGYNRNLQR